MGFIFVAGAIFGEFELWKSYCNGTSNPPLMVMKKENITDIFFWEDLVERTLFSVRRATRVIVQTHQILRLPRKMNPMTAPCHTWQVIYKAQSNMCPSRNSPIIAPAPKHDRPKSQRNLPKTAETSFTMRGRSEHDPTMTPSGRNPLRDQGYFSRPPRAFCSKKYIISRSDYHSKFHRVLRLPRKWLFIFTIPAPAMKNKSNNWSSSQLKPHLQCAERHLSQSRLTKYCACHENWISWFILFTQETSFSMRRATRVSLQLQQILRLPRTWIPLLILVTNKTWFTMHEATCIIPMTDPCQTGNVIDNAQSNMCHSPISQKYCAWPNNVFIKGSLFEKRPMNECDRSIWWIWSVTFRGRRSIRWNLEW